MPQLPFLAQAGGESIWMMVAPWVAIAVLFYFMIFRQERRRQSTHKQMLENIKKNDRVVTIGGIKGTVFAVRREADEITLRLDDNVKVRFTIAAIARVEPEGAETKDVPAA